MPRAVTPQRRRRDDHDDLDTVGSQGSKRQRRDSENGSPERPLLPDSYRRSPNSSGRAQDVTGGLQQDPVHQQHHPGSIIRVTLRNFVTFTEGEFTLGPNLNMIIGPNGSGKSTLVCAICIGLGWSTSHLGRAKDVTEYVQHGKNTAEIEIELKSDPLRHPQNPVIMHRISKDGGGKSNHPKSTYFINGKKSSSKAVQDLARSFSIQVDNLCQFLPQDRVVEFAALSPVDLLASTLRAAAPGHMSDWHEELKQMHKEEKEKEAEQQNVTEKLKNLESRQRSQRVEVERLQEREAKREENRILEKLRPFAEYEVVKQRFLAAKEREKTVAKDLKHLQRQMQPNLDAVEAKTEYAKRLNNQVEQKVKVFKKTEDEAQSKLKGHNEIAAELNACEAKIQSEKNETRKDKQQKTECQKKIRQIENAMSTPPLDFDAEEMNSQIRRKRAQAREIGNQMASLNQSVNELDTRAKQYQEVIEQQKKKKIFAESQAGKQTSRLEAKSPNIARAWRWIQENRDMFAGEVYGPPMITCSVKDTRYAGQIETMVGENELLAFTVTSGEDWAKLQHQLEHVVKVSGIPLRTIAKPLEFFRPPCSAEELKREHFEHWLLDMLDGPDAVLAMLCDNSAVHEIAFTKGDISNSQVDRLVNTKISKAVTSTQGITITRRAEYGAGAVSTRVTEVRPAKIFTNAPPNTQAEQDINRQITEAEGELGIIRSEKANVKKQWSELQTEKQQIETEQRALEDEKAAKQASKTEFDGLPVKLAAAKTKLKKAQDKIDGSNDRIMVIVEEQDELCLKKGQQVLDHARTLDSVRKLREQLLEFEIMCIEAHSDVQQLTAKHEKEAILLKQKGTELEQAKAEKAEARERGERLRVSCSEMGENFSDEEREVLRVHREGGLDPEKLENEIEQLRASLEMLHGGNENLIVEYESRAKKIDHSRTLLLKLQQDVSDVTDQIARKREQWEPELDRLVSQISEAFAENFARMHCAGEVAVHKADDFELWAIQIRVKFRENEQLSVLDSHRQSGGERAVSTIYYLMALQSLARAPFRVVDEINQGMDPRNERLVHSRMVEIACAEHTSQYFLITPKLLNNLTYHPNMKVHCIASGEYMPEDHRELDFAKLARKALAIKASAAS